MPKILQYLICFIFFGLAAVYSTKTPPKGDELHYLITAHSIVYDQDLAIGNNYEQKDYNPWYQGELDSHAIAGSDGKQYMYHGLGLFPVLLAIPYAIGGRIGVHLLLVGLFVVLLDQIYRCCLELKVRKNLALGIISIFAFTTPILNYSFLMFPEITGALLLLYAIRKHSALAAGLLPWIHLRFFPISIALLFFVKSKKLTVLLIVLYFVFYWYIYGTINPNDVYARAGINTQTGNILQNIILALTDAQYGLLFFAPIYVFGIAGLKKIRDTRYTFAFIFSLILYAVPVFRYYDWNGGYSPPGRYLVTFVPLLIAPAVVYLQKNKLIWVRIIFVLFTMWSLFASFVNLFLTKDYGFVYMNGYSEVLNRAWSLVHFNIYRLAPLYFPDKEFKLLHLVWLLYFICVTTLLLLPRKRFQQLKHKFTHS